MTGDRAAPSETSGADAPQGRRAEALRRAAFRQALGAAELDAALIFGPGGATGMRGAAQGGLRFLSGWNGHEAPSLLIINRDREATPLWVGSPFLTALARERWDAGPVSLVPPLGPLPPDLAAALGAPARLGLIGVREAPAGLAAAVMAARPDAEPVDPLLDRLRAVKDAAALARHRAGGGICDALWDQLGAELRSGDAIWRVQGALEHRARMAGADYAKLWITAAPVPDRPRYWPEETKRAPAEGDTVLCGIALTLDGCWAHGVRMGTLGPPSAATTALHARVSAALDAGLAALTPGAALAACRDAMAAALASDPLGAPGFRLGHGLGYSYEDPTETAAFSQPWEAASEATAATAAAGTVLELHPSLFAPEIGAAALGEMVVVGEDGPRSLLGFPRALQTW